MNIADILCILASGYLKQTRDCIDRSARKRLSKMRSIKRLINTVETRPGDFDSNNRCKRASPTMTTATV